jgi:site-specific DNA-methyltransferase (adenine-specific)
VEQAKKLNPRFLSMIMPARRYSGGKGLDDFRAEMLADKRMEELHDFPETSDCFPGLNIRGGVCYFLWSKDYEGNCKITTHKSGTSGEIIVRPLLEEGTNVFVRYNEAIAILNKIKYLSGTPFRAIATGEFIEEQIFNWTYSDEQKAKENWHDKTLPNPYLSLPQMVMMT